MAKQKSVLKNCLDRINENIVDKTVSVDLEIYAINNLTEEKDIKKFYREYKNCFKTNIQYQLDKKKKTQATKLITNEGNSLARVSTYFLNDALSFTLGHMYNQKTLKNWYGALPQLSRPYFLNGLSKML
ncbi:MAG: hypothetical protein ABIB43_03510 [archaeon]